MGWVKLDDQVFRHPKVVGAGRDARLLSLAALCYAGFHLTDGVIPSAAVRVLAAAAERMQRAKFTNFAGEQRAKFTNFAGEQRAKFTSFSRDDDPRADRGSRGVRVARDHVIPVSRGGSSDRRAVVTSCVTRNRSTRATLGEEWQA